MEVNYYLKYLKYKNKYTKLKKQLGGDTGKKIEFNKECKTIDNENVCKKTNNCYWGYINAGENKCHSVSCNYLKDNDLDQAHRGKESCLEYSSSCIWDDTKNKCSKKKS